MLIFYAIVFSIVQGLTEFIPVSSSGHLFLLHDILNFNLSENLGFDVFLHFGTLLSLIIYFRKEIKVYLSAFFKSFIEFDVKNNHQQKTAWQIFLATIPASLVGAFFYDKFSYLFTNLFSISIMLILVGVLFIIIETFKRTFKQINELSWLNAVLIGCAQIFSLIPGVSRSGITIIAGMQSGLKREQAAKFSFLLAIPIIFLASIKACYDLILQGLNFSEIQFYLIAFIFSFLAGLLAIKYFLNFLNKYSLIPFGIYRIVLGIIILVALFI